MLSCASLLFAGAAVADTRPLPGGETRLAGSDRYATATAISRASFTPPTQAVFIASGLDFPDALSSGPAAARLDAPVILVGRGALNDHARAELARLQPETIYVIGGTGAVSSAMDSELGQFGRVVRLQGPNRYATAAAVSSQHWDTSAEVVIASGETFADALSGGPAAAKSDAPMLLTNATTLPDVTRDELTRLQPSTVYLLGGTAAIATPVQEAIARATGARIVRLSAADRFGTSVAVARQFWPSMKTVFFATGTTFPDAVAGTPAAAVNDAPILLTRATCMPPVVAQLKRERAPSTVAILGGTGVVANSGVTTECTIPGHYSGRGDDVINITKPGGAGSAALATLTHNGRANFIVWGLDNRLDEVDLLTNEIGLYNGTVFMPPSVTRLDIKADGDWSIQLKALSAARTFNTGTISGSSDDVIRWTGGNRTVRFQHNGQSNFIVWGVAANGSWDHLYVNEIGPYNGASVVRSSSPYLLVTANGTWSMQTN